MAADSTQYLIDIATKLSGADSAAASLSTLGDEMLAAGASSEALDAAVVKANAALEESGAAMASAAAELKIGEDAYKQAEVAADRAAKAVEAIGLKAEEQRGKLQAAMDAGDGKGAERAAAKLTQLVAAEETAASKADALSDALEDEAHALDALRSKAEDAADAQKDIGKSAGNLKAASTQATKLEAAMKGSGKVNEMAEAFGRLGGPLGRTGQQVFGMADGFRKLGGSMGPTLAIAAGATVIIAAITAALVAGVIALGAYAIGLADMRRNAELDYEALAQTSDALAGLSNLIPEVSARTGVAAEQLAGLAKQLDEAGVSAKDMPDALHAVAIAEAALGKGAAAKLVKDLKEGKKSASALAAEMDKKFGGIVAKKMLSLDAQAATLKTNMADIFGGLDIEPLLQGLSVLVGLFDQNTVMGKTLKFVFEGLFQPLLDAAVAVIPKVERFILGIAIGALKLYVAFKPAINAVKELAGAADLSFLPDILTVGKVVAGLFAVAIVGVVAALVALYAPVLIAIAAFTALKSAGMAAWDGIKSGITTVMGFLSALDFGAIAMSLIQGLANGITSGVGIVVDAIRNLGSSAMGALKGILGIASPSKVFEQFGGFTAEGFAEGVDGGADQASTALESMVETPDASGAPAGASASTGGKFNITINVSSKGDAESIAEAVRRAVTEVLEGDGLQLGAGEVPA